MVKLVILIEPADDWQHFQENWPQFLHYAEEMPGLVREATSQIEVTLFGHSYQMMHELFFDSRNAAEEAMSSPTGRAAGRLLQHITGGNLTLFFADYKEDDIDNIRKYKPGSGE
jgi:uncharacterized protein (TIGR02118 family)